MSLASAAGRLVGHYRGEARGYDSVNARLIDFSSRGLHLPKLSGTPAFAAYSGKTAMTMRGDTYFGAPLRDGQPVVPTGPSSTWIAVVWANLLGGEIFDFIAPMKRDYAGSDPAWTTPTSAFQSSAAATEAQRLTLRADPAAYGGNLITPVSTPYTASAWSVIQVVNDPDTFQFRIRVGTGSWVTVATTANQNVVQADDFRLGYRSSPITTTGGKDVAMGQTLLFAGVAPDEKPTEYAALIAGLMADPLS